MVEDKYFDLVDKYFDCHSRYLNALFKVATIMLILSISYLAVTFYYNLKFPYISGLIMGYSVTAIIYIFIYNRIHKKYGL